MCDAGHIVLGEGVEEVMRVEFNIIIKYPNGKIDHCDYHSKNRADVKFDEIAHNDWYKNHGCKVTYIKSYWYDSSFHHKEILGEL